MIRWSIAGAWLAGCAHEPPPAPTDPTDDREVAPRPPGATTGHQPSAPTTGRGDEDDRTADGRGDDARGGEDGDEEDDRTPAGGRNGGKKGAPVPPPAPIGAPPGSGPRTPAAPPSGIHQISSREWTITDELLDSWKSSPSALGHVRKVDGGWQVYGVRQRAGYSLGLRNGDVITLVNGHRLETKTQQIGAWFDLRNDETFEVVFLRDGHTYNYLYRTIH